MAWLNINKEFGFLWSEVYDWEHDLDEEYFNWCTDPDCPCDKCWDGDIFNLSPNPLPLSCDHYPFRESFRKEQFKRQGWCNNDDRNQKVGKVVIYKFADRILKYNLGRSFDEVFSYYCRKTKHIKKDRYYWFMYKFNSSIFPYYQVDENGLIQVHPKQMRRSSYYREIQQKRDRRLVNFKSFDYKLEFIHKITNRVWTSNEYFKTFDKDHIDGNFIPVVVSGYKVENVQVNSKLWKRLVHEYIKARRKANKAQKKLKKEKQYSFITQEELALKRDK